MDIRRKPKDIENDAIASNQMTIGIVDPSSAGYFIARRATERGLKCIGIFSSGVTPSDIDFDGIRQYGSSDFGVRLTEDVYHAIIPGAESGVRLAEELAGSLGLAGNDPSTTDRRRNKTAMAHAARAAGVDICRQARCGSVEDCVAWADSTGYPVVVKPEASSGSDLVRVCQASDDILQHASVILDGFDKYGHNTRGVLIQEFMDGDEYTVDGVVSGGALTVFAVGKYRKINRDGSIIYDKIDFFSPFDPAVDNRILTYCHAVAKAVGVSVGPVHIEIMLTAKGPLLVEIAARAHGGIGTSVIDANFEPSFIDAIIDSYLPGSPSLNGIEVTRKNAASIAFLITDRAGTLVDMPGEATVRNLSSFVRLKWFVAPGEQLVKTVDLASCPALVELSHESRDVVEADIGQIRALEARGGMLEIA